MKRKHNNSFEFIDNKILDKLNKKDKERLFKYRRVRRDIIKLDNDIDELNNIIKSKKEKVNRYNEILNYLYSQIEYLKSDFDPKINVVINNKKGKKYWNLNIKYKSSNKPIYLGSDKVIRKKISEIHNVRINVNENKLRDLLYYELSDNIKDWVIENKENIFNMKITLNEILEM